jgi:uncharacterized membrane-anchored protein YhcB (DUF1043 family)
MNRWAARIIGLIMLLLFGLMFAQMHKTLTKLQQQQEQQAR